MWVSWIGMANQASGFAVPVNPRFFDFIYAAAVAGDDLYHADPAGAARFNSRVMAKRRNLYAGQLSSTKDCLSLLHFDLLTIYR